MDTATAKPTAAEVAQLRAEMRRRKILERGDERMRKLFGESKDEETNSLDERNKNLIEEIKKDPVVLEKLNSIDKDEPAKESVREPVNGPVRESVNEQTNEPINEKIKTTELSDFLKIVEQNLNNQDNTIIGQTFKSCLGKIGEKLNSEMANLDFNHAKDAALTDLSSQSTNKQPATKPLIDLSYFEKLEKKERLKKERLELSRLQLFVIHLVSILTLKRDLILMNVFKIVFACLASYFSFNIVTPFILSQSICYFYFNLNETFSNQFSLKLSYNFIKTNLLDSFTFFFFFTIVQII